MKISHEWLQSYIDAPLPQPVELAELITARMFEVEEVARYGDDTVYEIKILPDRAHDCLSHFGLAREICAVFGYPLIAYDAGVGLLPPETDNHSVTVSIVSGSCNCYHAQVMTVPEFVETPAWMARRLLAVGQRTINVLVDTTNYVLLSMGQPTHVFDYKKIAGAIEVRMAAPLEHVTLLGGAEVVLQERHQVIADSEGVLALAGVKGGEKAVVDDNTQVIVLESAHFDPVVTRHTARQNNLFTDASKRFENSPSPLLAEMGMDYLARLLCDIAGCSVGKRTSVFAGLSVEEVVIEVLVSDISELLGVVVDTADVSRMLLARGFSYVERDGVYSVTVPWFRRDISCWQDIAEEIGKGIGYEKVPYTVPQLPTSKPIPSAHGTVTWVRELLLSGGYSEVHTYSFRNVGSVSVLSAPSDKTYLRENLMSGFVQSLEMNTRNKDVLGFDVVRQFEIGTVFPESGEELHYIFGVSSGNVKTDAKLIAQEKQRLTEVFGAPLDVVLESGNCLECRLPTRAVVDVPDVRISELAVPNLFSPWSVYPAISRDIAVWVPEGTPCEVLVRLYIEHTGALLAREPRLFDTFTKDGRTSYAYRLVFQSYDHTLTDIEVAPLMERITDTVVARGWEVR